MANGFSPRVTALIRLLISLDFAASNDEAALIHLRGLWAMAANTPNVLVDAQELLRVSDAWISISLLKAPEISPFLYDPGVRRIQRFDNTLRSLELQAGLDTAEVVGHISRPWSALDSDTWTLLLSAQEAVNTKHIMDHIDNRDVLDDVVQWWNRRSAALTGYCTSGFVTNMGAPGSPIPRASSRTGPIRLLAAASCLCAMMFMNFKFVDSLANYDFSKTCKKIELVLREIAASREPLTKAGAGDLLWMLLLTAMGSDLFSARGDISFSSWPATEFHRVLRHLDLGGADEVRAHVRCYPHYAELIIFLDRLLSESNPSTQIVPWPVWKVVLNHA
jgi:hypothetical protein